MFITNQLLFYIALVIILFLPGYFLLLAVFGCGEKNISQIERFVFSFGFSIITIDFIAFILNGLTIPITAGSSILGVVIFCAICFGIYKKRADIPLTGKHSANEKLFDFSKNQFALILILLFFTFFLRLTYLTNSVSPTATDMGHHLYWTKLFTQTHHLPDYEGMPDFIIGEHVALGEIAMISHLDFFGAGPVVFLLLFDLLGILTVFLLVLKVFKNKKIALLAILFSGVLFAVASPQAKFISGGVMGNTLGNFLIPMSFYFYFRAFEFLGNKQFAKNLKPSRNFLALALFVTFGLFYTHHLSAFVFLFVFLFLIPSYLIMNFKNFYLIISQAFKIIFSKKVLLVFFTGLIFIFFIFTPNYIQTNAVETTLGAPSKATRQGLSINNLQSSLGQSILILGLIGLLILLSLKNRKKIGQALIFSWTVALLVMSMKPEWIFVNIPSNRIGNYLSFPLAILSALTFYSFLFYSQNHFFQKTKKLSYFLSPSATIFVFSIFLAFSLSEGLGNTVGNFKDKPNFFPTIQTFQASSYLQEKINPSDIILKDHNYLDGDSWMKLFFMQGYKYPLSRGYFKRYEDPTKPREMCTLQMISNPGSANAQNCFSQTGTKYIVVNPHYDSSQFKKLSNFDLVYLNSDVAVFHRK